MAPLPPIPAARGCPSGGGRRSHWGYTRGLCCFMCTPEHTSPSAGCSRVARYPEREATVCDAMRCDSPRCEQPDAM